MLLNSRYSFSWLNVTQKKLVKYDSSDCVVVGYGRKDSRLKDHPIPIPTKMIKKSVKVKKGCKY